MWMQKPHRSPHVGEMGPHPTDLLEQYPSGTMAYGGPTWSPDTQTPALLFERLTARGADGHLLDP